MGIIFALFPVYLRSHESHSLLIYLILESGNKEETQHSLSVSTVIVFSEIDFLMFLFLSVSELSRLLKS